MPLADKQQALIARFQLIQDAHERLAAALTKARAEIHPCRHCGFYAQGADSLCSICANSQRDQGLWCIVEQASDVIKLEKSNFFRGLYHVLGGRLSPLDHVGPEDLSIAKMEQRLAEACLASVVAHS